MHLDSFLFFWFTTLRLLISKNDFNAITSAKGTRIKNHFIVKLFQCLGPFIKYNTFFLHFSI